jgi:glucose-6-phosphate isomerase
MILDFTRQKMTLDTIEILHDFVKKAGLFKKISEMEKGGKVNITENRSALHTALRMPKDS